GGWEGSRTHPIPSAADLLRALWWVADGGPLRERPGGQDRALRCPAGRSRSGPAPGGRWRAHRGPSGGGVRGRARGVRRPEALGDQAGRPVLSVGGRSDEAVDQMRRRSDEAEALGALGAAALTALAQGTLLGAGDLGAA